MMKSFGRWVRGLIAVLPLIAVGVPAHAQTQTLDAVLKRGKVLVGINTASPPFGMTNAEMQPDGRFGKLNQHERESVDGGLKDMSALFDKTPEVAGMNDADKRKMFNTQEAVNATLLRNDGDRLICKKEIRSGTYFQSTTCRTARDIERDRNGAQDWARKTLQLPNDWDGT